MLLVVLLACGPELCPDGFGRGADGNCYPLPEGDDTATTTDDTGEAKSYYEANVQPIWNAHCVECHAGEEMQKAPNLLPDVSHGNLVGVAAVQMSAEENPTEFGPMNYVDPGNPGTSYLYYKVTGTHEGIEGLGKQMPSDPDPEVEGVPLSDDQIRNILVWIQDGAEP